MLVVSNTSERESVKVLRECIDLQLKKSQDYQNPNSTVKQADYYPSGVRTILEIVEAKLLRIRSLIEAHEFTPGQAIPKNEPLIDSALDGINYLSFLAAYLRGGIDGQNPNNDMLNRPIPGSYQVNVPSYYTAAVAGATANQTCTTVVWAQPEQFVDYVGVNNDG